MPRDSTKTRQRILDAAYTLFHRSGYSRVGVDEIAAGANVTKRTLYSHYPSKDALLAECLRSQAALAADGFKSWGQRLPASRDALVDALFDALSKWSATPRWAGSGFTRVAVELTDLPGHPARAIARRHKAMLEDYLTELLQRAGVEPPRERARQLWIVMEGAMLMALICGDRSYIASAQRAARMLLSASEPSAPAKSRLRC